MVRGDRELVGYLREVRKHAGFMVPGPVQQAGGGRPWATRTTSKPSGAGTTSGWCGPRRSWPLWGCDAPLPGGGFYLWAPAPGRRRLGVDAWLAETGGVLVSPGSFYGPGGAGYVRLAMVAPLERLDLVARRLGV